MGTEEFWIPAAIAALGTGGEAYNQSQAAKRQDSAQAQSIMDQQQIQQRAAGEVNKQITNIQHSNPNDIANKATGDYVQQLRRNAASGSALAPAVGGSSRYKGDVTASNADAQTYGGNLASEMGSIDAATRQRQNEGLDMQTLGTKLNTLGAESYGTNFVGQLRAQSAGQQNPWMSLASGLLKNGAAAYSMGAGAGKAGSLAKTATQSGNGLAGWTAGLA